MRGRRSQRSHLEKTVQQEGLSAVVRFLGYRALGPSLLSLYREADIFVHSSMTEVSIAKPQSMEGMRFLLLEKIDPVNLKGKGDYVVGIDSVGANAEEIVFYVTGSSARMTETTKGKPSDATIIAVVDLIEKDGAFTYEKSRSGDTESGR